MDNVSLTHAIAEWTPGSVFEESGEWLTLTVLPADWQSLARHLHDSPPLQFDFLFCVTGVDWKTHLSVVYHLRSTVHEHTLVVKITLDRNTPLIDSVAGIWRTAEFHEREVYDLLGVQFQSHPDLRRLFMTEEQVGWPLRKDYEDPINMIRL